MTEDDDYPPYPVDARYLQPSMLVRLRALSERWSNQADVFDASHATMGMGYRACATDLAHVLSIAKPDYRVRLARRDALLVLICGLVAGLAIGGLLVAYGVF